MGIDKAKIKIGTLDVLGNKFDDALEEAQRNKHQKVGGASALKAAKVKLEDLYRHVDKDIDEGRVPTDSSPLAVAKYAKQYVQRAVGLVENMAVSAELGIQQASGLVEGLRQAVQMTKKEVDAEAAKITSIAKALETGTISFEDGDIPERTVGTHPGNPIAGRRAESQSPEPEPELEPEPDEVVDLEGMNRQDLLKFAEEKGIEVDRRWSAIRIRRTVEEALGASDAENT